ncbi:antirestriction protein ArdA [Paenibacillus sp. RS8]|uniref:antirestriction protein ArdA n=1 Tax=Paenibacillus sp. RS8 TaxID=3242681 RepID=UPI0035C0B3BF
MIEAFVTNLGRYNEGHLIGEYLKFPSTTQDVQELFKRIGVDGVRYEEIFITDYKTAIPALRDYLGESESLDELNYLASLLEDLPEWETEKFAAALELGEFNSVKDLINLSENLDCYAFIDGITSEEDLGRYYIEELGAMEIPDHLQSYIDYEAYGRDVCINENGLFVNNGYVLRTEDSFREFYSGRNDLPEQHRIFAYPKSEKASIRDTLKQYQKKLENEPSPGKDRPSSTIEDR